MAFLRRWGISKMLSRVSPPMEEPNGGTTEMLIGECAVNAGLTLLVITNEAHFLERMPKLYQDGNITAHGN